MEIVWLQAKPELNVTLYKLAKTLPLFFVPAPIVEQGCQDFDNQAQYKQTNKQTKYKAGKPRN